MENNNNLVLEYSQITLRPLEKGLLPVQLWASQNWCKKNSVKLLMLEWNIKISINTQIATNSVSTTTYHEAGSLQDHG
jgi:hypothetical protein